MTIRELEKDLSKYADGETVTITAGEARALIMDWKEMRETLAEIRSDYIGSGHMAGKTLLNLRCKP